MSDSLPKISRYVFRIQVQASEWGGIGDSGHLVTESRYARTQWTKGCDEYQYQTPLKYEYASQKIQDKYIFSPTWCSKFFLQRIVGELFCGNMWKRRKMSFPRLSSPSLPTTSTWTVRPTSIDRWTFNKNKPDKRSFTPTFDFLCYFNTPQYINIWRSNSSLKVQARRRQYCNQINLEPFLATNNVTVRPRKSCKF